MQTIIYYVQSNEFFSIPDDCNIISVDWKTLAAGPNYPRQGRVDLVWGSKGSDLLLRAAGRI